MADHRMYGTAGPPRSAAAAPTHDALPADALAVRAILRSMGAEEAEPRVLAMLLDFVYTYAADVLQDAEAYGEALGRPPGAVELGELSLAIQARPGGGALSQPPPQDVLQRLAEEVRRGRVGMGLRWWCRGARRGCSWRRQRLSCCVLLPVTSHPSHPTLPPPPYTPQQVNSIDLPEFPLRHGLRLPPNEDCLVMPNWELLPPSQQQQQQRAGGGGGGGHASGQQRQQRQSGGGGAAPMDTA